MHGAVRPQRQCRAAAAAGVIALVLSGGAHAQWSGSAAVESDYRFRGISLSSGRPSLRLSGNYDGAGGWYAGAAATQSQLAPGERYAQVLAYAGRVLRVGASTDLEFGATASAFVGEHRYGYAEAYAGVLFPSATLRLSYSPDYFGWHVSTAYVDVTGHLPLGASVRLLGHAGWLEPLSHLGRFGPDASRARADWRVGVGWAVRDDVDLTLAWSGATRGGPPPVNSPQRRTGWALAAAWYF